MSGIPLKNKRWEAFALAVGTGSTATDAWRKVTNCSNRTAETMGSRLQKRVEIKSRIQEIRRGYESHRIANGQETVTKKYLTLDRSLELLAAMANAKPKDVDENSDICQGIEYKTVSGNRDNSSYETVKVKLPDKIRAIELSCKLQGMLIDKHALTDTKGNDLKIPCDLLQLIQGRKKEAAGSK